VIAGADERVPPLGVGNRAHQNERQDGDRRAEYRRWQHRVIVREL
jgi:hypothetical protein